MLNTFRFGESKNNHVIGDANCRACRWDVPQPCTACDTGLIHTELNPKKVGPVLVFHCDVCAGKGKNWNFA